MDLGGGLCLVVVLLLDIERLPPLTPPCTGGGCAALKHCDIW